MATDRKVATRRDSIGNLGVEENGKVDWYAYDVLGGTWVETNLAPVGEVERCRKQLEEVE